MQILQSQGGIFMRNVALHVSKTGGGFAEVRAIPVEGVELS